MNNGLFDEQLNRLKQQDLLREIERLQLLREAGLANPGLLARAGGALKGGLLALVRRRKERKAIGQATYKPASEKTVL